MMEEKLDKLITLQEEIVTQLFKLNANFIIFTGDKAKKEVPIFDPAVCHLMKTVHRPLSMTFKSTNGAQSHGNLYYYNSNKGKQVAHVWDFGFGSPADFPKIVPLFAGEQFICSKESCYFAASSSHPFCPKCMKEHRKCASKKALTTNLDESELMASMNEEEKRQLHHKIKKQRTRPAPFTPAGEEVAQYIQRESNTGDNF